MLEVDDSEKRKLLREETTSKIIGAAFEVQSAWIRISRARLPTRTSSGVASPRRNSRTGEAYSGALQRSRCWRLRYRYSGRQLCRIEVKVASQYDKRDEAQLLNELKATRLKVGLLVNFGRTKLEYKRLVF